MNDWLDRATCATEKMLPSVFDATSYEEPGVEEALEACARCPVSLECHLRVFAPGAHVWYDGIVAGRIYKDGRIVRQPRAWRQSILRPECGRVRGPRLHKENHEFLCADCANEHIRLSEAARRGSATRALAATA